MKVLDSIRTNEVQLEVIECDCGLHLGIDSRWLKQSEAVGFEMNCPACNTIIKVEKLTRPYYI